MKRIAAFTLVMFVFSLCHAALVQAQEAKMGYIDTVNIFAEFRETIEAEEIYKKELEAWKRDADEMEAEIAQLREELQSQSLMLSEEKLAEKKLVLEQKFTEYQQFMNDVFGEDKAFVVEVLESGWSVHKAEIEYLKRANDRKDKELAKLKSSAPPAGGGHVPASDQGDFMARAKALAKVENTKITPAMRKLAAQDPEGYRAYCESQRK